MKGALLHLLAHWDAFQLALKVSMVLNRMKGWEVWQASHFSKKDGGAGFCSGYG